MNVLITGGAGFIGTNLRMYLERLDSISSITVLDDLTSGFEENLANRSKKSSIVIGSICDNDLVKELISNTDAVVHLAARPSVPRSISDPVSTTRANVEGTFSVLEAVRLVNPRAHIIFASSSSVYGSNTHLPKQEDQGTFPLSPYAASKLAGEAYALAYQNSYGIPVTAFRFFNVYGPYQRPGHAYAAVVPAFLQAAIENRPIPVHGDGLQTRDFTYVGTLVEAISIALVRAITWTRPVNLAFGTRISLLELVQAIESTVSRSLSIDYQPVREGDVRDSQAANAELLQLFPDLKSMNLQDGLRITHEWMKAFLLHG